MSKYYRVFATDLDVRGDDKKTRRQRAARNVVFHQ